MFHSLSREHIREIVDLDLNDVRTNLREKEITLEVTEALLDHLASKGWDPVFGARPLRRTIQNDIEDTLSDALLEGHYEEGDAVRMDVVDGDVTVERLESPPADLPEAEVEAEPEAEPGGAGAGSGAVSD